MTAVAVELSAADGLTLRGELLEGGAAWAVLVHDAGEDLDAWRPLDAVLAGRRWTVLALDLRGHGGSDDPWDPERAHLDVEASLAFARARGAAARCVVAAGAGALAALRAVPAAEPDALVLLSPGPLGAGGTEGLRGQGASKLILAGSQDAAGSEDADALRRASIGWTLVVSLPTAERGTALLRGECADQAREHLLAFLEEQRFLAGDCQQ